MFFGSSQTAFWLPRNDNFTILGGVSLAVCTMRTSKDSSVHTCFSEYQKNVQRCTLWLMRVTGMVWRPYHGPGVDVEELAPTAWPVAVIAHSAGVMRRLQLVPIKRDHPVRTVWDQGQSAQNVIDRDNVDDRLWLRLIEELRSSVGHLPPPVGLPPAGWSEV